jgi:hypothetical protein
VFYDDSRLTQLLKKQLIAKIRKIFIAKLRVEIYNPPASTKTVPKT